MRGKSCTTYGLLGLIPQRLATARGRDFSVGAFWKQASMVTEGAERVPLLVQQFLVPQPLNVSCFSGMVVFPLLKTKVSGYYDRKGRILMHL
jgi:hypothetical protein